MKIIFSRKGFDASYGGRPSPILPDGRAVSLPIPIKSRTTFADVSHDGRPVASLVEDLTGGTLRGTAPCHLDPDLDNSARLRPPDWRPAFGQVGAAQAHLARQGVGPGDLFLFFGWFKEVERGPDGRWRYVRGARDVHRLFGWLQVGRVLRVGSDVAAAREAWPSLAAHPHLEGDWPASNTVYVASRHLDLPGVRASLPGGGVFRGNDRSLTLTAQGSNTRSVWGLPEWFLPDPRSPALSYHRNPKRWDRRDGRALVKTVGRGQEFVADLDGREDAPLTWLATFFRSA